MASRPAAAGTRPAIEPAPTARRTWVIMLSGSPWQAAAHRQQALAAELAADDSGFRVLFVDPPANLPKWRFEVRQVQENLWQATVPSPLPGGRQLPVVNRIGRRVSAGLLQNWLADRPGPRLLWVDEDLAAPLIGRLGAASTVYDATDLDWTFTRRWNRRNLRRSLSGAVGAADLVLASSSALPGRLPAGRRPPVLVPNACDPEHFAPLGFSAPQLARLPRPLVGYLGAIDTRAFDAPLVAQVARSHPQFSFVLVGPSTRAGRQPLETLPNVHLLPAVPYSMAPTLVRSFDVGIIPYRTGGLIDYVHPKKCYEYLAAGKPVVATTLPALVELDAPIRLADGAVEFAAAIEAALGEAHHPELVERRRTAAAANSWQIRGAQVRDLLAGLEVR